MGCDIHIALEWLDKGTLTWKALEPSLTQFLITASSEEAHDPKPAVCFDLDLLNLRNDCNVFEESWKNRYKQYKAAADRREQLRAGGLVSDEDIEYVDYPYVFVHGKRDYDLFTMLSNVRGEFPSDIGNILIPDHDCNADYSEPIDLELAANRDYHSPGYATLDRLVRWRGWNMKFPTFTFRVPYSSLIKNGKWRKHLKVAMTGGPHEEPEELPTPDKIMSPLKFELLCLDKRTSIVAHASTTGYPPVDSGFVVTDQKLADELATHYRNSWGNPASVPCRLSPTISKITPTWFFAFMDKLKHICKTNEIEYHQLRLVCCYDN